jgi:hypothetical protein
MKVEFRNDGSSELKRSAVDFLPVALLPLTKNPIADGVRETVESFFRDDVVFTEDFLSSTVLIQGMVWMNFTQLTGVKST